MTYLGLNVPKNLDTHLNRLDEYYCVGCGIDLTQTTISRLGCGGCSNCICDRKYKEVLKRYIDEIRSNKTNSGMIKRMESKMKCKNKCCSSNLEGVFDGSGCGQFTNIEMCSKSWIESEIPEKKTDWSKVEKFTKVYVRGSRVDYWKRAYFVSYDETLFKVCFVDPWLSSDPNFDYMIEPYSFCKLAEDQDS